MPVPHRRVVRRLWLACYRHCQCDERRMSIVDVLAVVAGATSVCGCGATGDGGGALVILKLILKCVRELGRIWVHLIAKLNLK